MIISGPMIDSDRTDSESDSDGDTSLSSWLRDSNNFRVERNLNHWKPEAPSQPLPRPRQPAARAAAPSHGRIQVKFTSSRRPGFKLFT
jgi:hypothetical protein